MKIGRPMSRADIMKTTRDAGREIEVSIDCKFATFNILKEREAKMMEGGVAARKHHLHSSRGHR